MKNKLIILVTIIIAFVGVVIFSISNKKAIKEYPVKDVQKEEYKEESLDSFQEYINANSITVDYISFNKDENSTQGYIAYNKGKERTPYLAIYDFKTNKVLKTTEISKVEKQRFYTTKNGICRIVLKPESKTEIYDKELNYIKDADLSPIAPLGEFRKGTISDDFTKIAFIENNKGYSYLYVSNLDYSSKELIVKFKQAIDKPYDVSDITYMGFNEAKDKVLFLGTTYPKTGYDIEGIQCFGLIDLNTKKIVSYPANKVEIQLSSRNMLISDLDVSYRSATSGKVNILDFHGNKTEYMLKDNKESQNAFISPNGNYIVTFLAVDEEKTENYPVIIRVYNVNTKEVVKEIKTSFSGNHIHNSLNNKDSISINENIGKIYINYWDNEKQTIYEYDFK